MPSLLKYFGIVGGILFAGLIGLNAMLDPSGPGPKLVKDTPKVVVRIDPQASKVERLRTEEAALKAAEKANPEAHPVIVTEPLRLPPQPLPPPPAPPAITQVAAQPAPAPAHSLPAVLTAQAAEEFAPATRAAQEESKQKVAAEKARKKRVARERARAKAVQEASAARQQDQIYYSYAPRPTYGPFAQQGGFGGSWQGGWGRAW